MSRNNCSISLLGDDNKDTRFSNGMWEIKPNVKIDWATESVKCESKITNSNEKSLYILTTTSHIYDRGNTLNTPTISINLSSPNEGIICIESFHHKSANKNEPRFKLNDSNSLGTEDINIKINKEKYNAIFKTIGLLADVNTNPNSFNISFKDTTTNKELTKLGFRSIGFVEDSRTPPNITSSLPFSPYMTAQFHLGVREKVYGLGERFGNLIKNGQHIDIWNRDGGTSSEQAYKNIPFYLTNNGYGIFIDHTDRVSFEVQSERTTRVNVVVPGQILRAYIIKGPTPKEIIYRYNLLTGKPSLPPPWTFGLWLTTSFTTNYDMETVSSFISGMQKREIPLSTFHFDCFWMKQFQWCDFIFDDEYFNGKPEIFIKNLKEKFGIRICVWINPYIAQESKLFEIADSKNYLIKNLNDETSWQTDLWQAGMGIVDFTNPNAIKWYQNILENLLNIGVDSFKTDFGERIPIKNIKYYNNFNPEKMHNYYTYLYNKAVFEILEKKKGKNNACLFARSATATCQKFPVHWGGDCESSFEAMAESLRGGLSLSLSGFGYWAHDIGGFEGSPDPAVYKRWCAFGLLSSHSRLHGSGSYRVPWLFGDEASLVLKKFTNLKLRLLPYIYSNAIETSNESLVSVMRALFVEFPNDITTWDTDSEFMLGSNLLVAPVFSGEKGEITYYVPNVTNTNNEWFGLLDGKVRTGGNWYKENHNFMSLPLLIKPNSVIITGDKDSTTDYLYNENFLLNIYNLSSSIKVKIPNFEKIGEYSTIINILFNSISKKIKINIEGEIINSWKFKIINNNNGVKEDNNKKIKLLECDNFGDKIYKVDASVKSIEFELNN